MNIRELMEVFDYKISEGSKYCWNCYGPNARFLDFDNDFACASIIFDAENQIIFQAEVWVKDSEDSPYRYINPNYIESHKKEAVEKGVDLLIAFDKVKFIDLEVPEDFLTKANAIWNNLPFDKRVEVPIDMDVFYDLAKLAHERDITVNKLVEEILTKLIEEKQNEIS